MLKVATDKGFYKNSWVHLVGGGPLPEDLVWKADAADSGFDLIVCSACMISGHFPNTCFAEMLKVLRPNAYMAFTIRDIYLNEETDKGMDFPVELAYLEKMRKIKKVHHTTYVKYKGVELGSGHREEGANVMIYQKLQ
jgi:SAM-dependent methyltransferase